MYNINRWYFTDEASERLSEFGVGVNAYNIVGSILKAGVSIDMQSFLTTDSLTIYNSIENFMMTKFNGNLDTSVFLCVDIEHPVAPKKFGDYLTNLPLLDSIIDAFKLRIKAVRDIMPNAEISLYGVFVPKGNGYLGDNEYAGYKYAKQQGLFNELDYIAPVLYHRFYVSNPSFQKHVLRAYTAISYARDSLNVKPLSLMLSYRVYNGNDPLHGAWQTAIGFSAVHDTIKKLSSKQDRIDYWNDGSLDSLTALGIHDRLVSYFQDSSSQINSSSAWNYNYTNNGIEFSAENDMAAGWTWTINSQVVSNNQNYFLDNIIGDTLEVCLELMDSCGCTNTTCKTVETVIASLGLNENRGELFSIFPNPCVEYLTVKSLSNNFLKNNEIMLYDRLGQKLGRYNSGTNEINISILSLNSGCYFIICGGVTKSFIKL